MRATLRWTACLPQWGSAGSSSNNRDLRGEPAAKAVAGSSACVYFWHTQMVWKLEIATRNVRRALI